MKDKVVIVTGGSSGMGKYMAKKFADEGAKVVITGRDEERLQEAKSFIEKTATGKVHTFSMDVRQVEGAEKMVEETLEIFGRIDHLVNNAAGVLSLTRTLAVEWGTKYGIRVNAIAPGPIERTGGAEKLMLSEEMAERTKKSVPLQRFGKPEEIAGLAYFLLSDEAAYINGEVVTMDGGQWLNPLPF